MKFKTHNEANISINGTGGQGSVIVDFADLIKTFGNPEPGCMEKTDVNWRIRFEDGTIATIYNWKNGRSYCGADGADTQDIKDWSIGGFNPRALLLVKDALSNTKELDGK